MPSQRAVTQPNHAHLLRPGVWSGPRVRTISAPRGNSTIDASRDDSCRFRCPRKNASTQGNSHNDRAAQPLLLDDPETYESTGAVTRESIKD